MVVFTALVCLALCAYMYTCCLNVQCVIASCCQLTGSHISMSYQKLACAMRADKARGDPGTAAITSPAPHAATHTVLSPAAWASASHRPPAPMHGPLSTDLVREQLCVLSGTGLGPGRGQNCKTTYTLSISVTQHRTVPCVILRLESYHYKPTHKVIREAPCT